MTQGTKKVKKIEVKIPVIVEGKERMMTIKNVKTARLLGLSVTEVV